jgi:glycosyltransferase involved in cell wall biosynthesis
MKISVITVCYNSAKTLERALKSVAEQDWPSIEHIVIDGGSTYETLAILQGYKHLAMWVSEPDKGIYDAMNKGLGLATGEIICFLNADDQYASSSILSYVAKLMMDHKLDALMGDVLFFKKDKPNHSVRRYRSDRFNPESLSWGWMPAHPGLFLSSFEVKRTGLFKVDYKIAGDFEFIIRFFNKENLRYQYVPIIIVRMQSGGVSNSGLRAKILLNLEVLRACRENGIKTNLFKILSKYPLKLLEFVDSK